MRLVRGLAWLAWFITMNAYFGWNLMPKSDAELICDGIGLLLLSLAYFKDRDAS